MLARLPLDKIPSWREASASTVLRETAVEVLTLHGLNRYFVFFVMELKTRRVHRPTIREKALARMASSGADHSRSVVDQLVAQAVSRLNGPPPLKPEA